MASFYDLLMLGAVRRPVSDGAAPRTFSLNESGSDNERLVGPNASTILGGSALTKLSISIWMKAKTNLVSYGSPFVSSSSGSWADGFGCYGIANPPRFWVNSYLNYLTPTTTTVTDWHHYLYVWDKTGANLNKLYVDGVLEATRNAASDSDFTPPAAVLTFGGGITDTIGPAARIYIRQMAIWTSALTAGNAVTLHNGGVAGDKALEVSPSTLKLFLRGTTDDNLEATDGVEDSSGNGNTFSGVNVTNADNLLSDPVV